MDDYKYWAFISYSHSDETWGKWLHRALERYRVPRRLVGRAGRHGPLPRRVIPIFRDRDELPTAVSLGDKIEKALRESRFLIVICSPKAAVSKWVNEEVAAFKRLAGEDRVLCLVVDGEPNASDKPDSGLLEAFPHAVRYRVDAAGHPTETRTEPIAADVRQGKDGATNAKLKLLAGMLDVDFDELKQRERRRRFWFRARLAAGAVVVAAAIAGVWYEGRQQKLASERARHERVAQLLVTKAHDAAERDDEMTASFYGAESIRESLLAGKPPLDAEFLASLALPARPDFTLAATGREGPLALSPDGTLLLTGADRETGTLWDVRAQKRRATLPRARIAMAAFDGASRHVATATAAGEVEVWSAATGAAVASVQRQGARVSAIALSPDGRLLAWAGDDHIVTVRRLDESAKATTFESNEHVLCLAFSPDGSLLASGSQERYLRLWGVERPELSRLLVHYADPVRSIAFSHDGALLAAGTWDSKVKLWDVSGRAEIAVLEGPAGHKQTVDSVAFSEDGTLLASGSLDGTVKLWEVSSHVLVATLTGHPKGLADVAFGGRVDALTSVSTDGTVMGWHVVPRKYVAAFTGHTKFVRAVAFSPDGRMLASAGDDTTIRLWDVATRRLLHPLEGHTDSVRALAFTPDGRWLASTGRDSHIMLWPRTGATVKSRRAHDTWIFALAMTPDGRAVATAGWDRDPTVKLWAVPGLTPLKTLAGGHAKGIGGLAASPDGRFLASAGNDGAVNLWDLKTYERIPLRSAQPPVMRAIVFSPDSRRLAVGDGTGWVHIWDVATRELAGPAFPAHHLRGHDTLMIWALAFSPDGRLLASGANSKDRQTIRLWDAAERRTVAWLTGHREFALAVAFSPDGHLLASGGSDATVRLWKASDFWPPRPDSAATSGALLRTFLAAKTHTTAEAERLVRDVGCVTRLAMLGTDAVPMPAAEERRCR